MTDDVKALAARWKDQPVVGPITDALVTLAKAYVDLCAKEAARGETVEACPKCYEMLLTADMVQSGWRCHTCWEYFHEPAYFQRIPAPEAQD